MDVEKLTRAQLLARLAYVEFIFTESQSFSVRERVESQFFSHVGYYDMSDEELRNNLAEISEEMDENWEEIDSEFEDWSRVPNPKLPNVLRKIKTDGR